jgi:hypothetical protein
MLFFLNCIIIFLALSGMEPATLLANVPAKVALQVETVQLGKISTLTLNGSRGLVEIKFGRIS